ncbi:NAD(P)H-dependent glycerol-3-phosphate dehydrogenase [bacterium]|nr:NAD(P)H-dependent glycerol-3-phosphate dehydrogenase [bacterium]
MNHRIGILGAGGWGTALAVLLHGNGHQVALWEFRRDAAEKLRALRENRDFLPGVAVPPEIEIDDRIQNILENRDLILIALPSHVVRNVLKSVKDMHSGETLWVSGTKGIENNSLKRVSEILAEEISGLKMEKIVAISGPSHAEEVGRKIPTAVTAASVSMESAETVQSVFRSPFFRIYTSPDITGVELGGSLKNVIAIAAGISDGVGCGDNTKAALMTRGLAEMSRLGTAMGANPLTFSGLSGIGDLIVTCTSRHSRNRFVGERIGRGQSLDSILDSMLMVAEGVRTARSVMELCRMYSVEMPISNAVFQVLFEGKNPNAALQELMTRDPKAEIGL